MNRSVKIALSGPFILLCTLIFGTLPGNAAEPPGLIEKWPDLSRTVDGMYQGLQPYETGGVTAIIHHGEVLHLKGYGAANRELNVPWTPDTRYLIASLTKSITASAILELVNRGCVEIDGPLSAHLPDFPRFDSTITLRHLLTMTSGLWQDELLMPLSGITGAVSLDVLYSLSRRQDELDFPPGATFRYTDTNFRLLARIITQCSESASYDEALKKLLFKPLGMESSSAPADNWVFENNQVPTYLTLPGQEGAPLTLDIHVPVSGDGGVRTTMRDLIRWLKYMREGTESGQSRWHRLNQPVRLGDQSVSSYRLGVYEFEHRGLKGIAHGGVTGTKYVFYPEIDLVVAVFQNDIGTFEATAAAQSLTDAFLMSKNFNESEFAMRPSWQALADAPPAALPPQLLAGLSGYYVEPSEGLVLALTEPSSGQLAVSYRGSSPHLLQGAAANRFTRQFSTIYGVGSPPLKITITGAGKPAGVELQLAEWASARRFERVTPVDQYPQPSPRVTGFYYSEVLDVVYSLRHEQNALILRIGSGNGPAQKFRLTKLTRNLFEAKAIDASFYDVALGLGRFAVKILRTDAGAVSGIRIVTDRIRKIDLQKMYLEKI